MLRAFRSEPGGGQVRIERDQRSDKPSRLAFGGFVLDPANALLWRGHDRINLPPKPFGVLRCLVERAGQLVTKDELFEAVWSNVHVTELSLSVSINALRFALGDDRKSPRFVETVTRRGYRFVAPVAVDAEPIEPPAQEAPPRKAAPRRGRIAGSAATERSRRSSGVSRTWPWAAARPFS